MHLVNNEIKRLAFNMFKETVVLRRWESGNEYTILSSELITEGSLATVKKSFNR